jgi:hypothetical protein
MTKVEVKELQTALNAFTRRFRLGYAFVKRDGELGPATRKRIREVKYLLGYDRKDINGTVGDKFLWRLKTPRATSEKFHVGDSEVNLGKRRRARRRKNVVRNHLLSFVTPGVTRFDGMPVAKEFVPYLVWARERRWKGVLSSGWRDPEFSESLCIAMCGAPTCPGRCAGKASRHSQKNVWNGAIDVTDYTKFGQLMASMPLNPPIRPVRLTNHLPIDPVHYSVAGN